MQHFQNATRTSQIRAMPLVHSRQFIFFTAFLLTLTACLLYATAYAGTGDSKEFRQTVDFDSGGRLSLEIYKGSVKLVSWDKNQVEIYARIEAGNNVSSRYAAESVEATKIDVYGSGGSVTIRSDYDDVPSDRSWVFGKSRTLPYVHYQIKAPKNVRLRIDDHKSDIFVNDFAGNFFIETHKGNVEAEKLSGESIFETHKGDLRLSDISGNIEINNYKGEVTLSVTDLQGRSRLETYKGRIDVRIPKNLAFTVAADMGRRGDFRSDFEIERRRDWRDDRDDYYIEQAINGGGPELRFRTTKGSIRLNY